MKYVLIEDAMVKASTHKALLVVIGSEEVWIPRSQLHDDCELTDKEDEGDLVIPAWLADKNDIAFDGEYE